MDFIQPKRKQRLSTKIEKVYFELKTIKFELIKKNGNPL
jgi:hypothetical protein